MFIESCNYDCVQALLSVEADKEDNWPTELLELRDKFTCNAKKEIEEIKKMHNAELIRLRDEHACSVARMCDQYQKEIASLKTQNSSNNQEVGCVESLENNIMEER